MTLSGVNLRLHALGGGGGSLAWQVNAGLPHLSCCWCHSRLLFRVTFALPGFGVSRAWIVQDSHDHALWEPAAYGALYTSFRPRDIVGMIMMFVANDGLFNGSGTWWIPGQLLP